MNSGERYDKSHTFTSNGGEITLNDDKTIRLNVPKGAFHQETLVKWSLHEDDDSTFPELDIIALDAKSGQEVPVFEKHVMIIHKNRGHSPKELSATVDNQGLPNQQVTIKDGDIEDDSMFHTFYRSTPDETTIFTKHFSKFRLLCSEKETYRATLNAALFQHQQSTEDTVHVDVKVVLDVNNTERKKADKKNWKIHDCDDYEYIQTIPINTPPGDDVVEKNGTFNYSATVRNKGWEYIDKRPKPKPIENVIPCRKCYDKQLLLDAAILQFRSDGTGSKSFVAELKFEILPSKDDACTVTEYDALIRIDVSHEASSDHDPVSTFQSTIPTNTSTISLKEHIQQSVPDSTTHGEERLDSGVDLPSLSRLSSTPPKELPKQRPSDPQDTQFRSDVANSMHDVTDHEQPTNDVTWPTSVEPSSTTDSVPVPNQSRIDTDGVPVSVTETNEKSVITGPATQLETPLAIGVRPDVDLHPTSPQSKFSNQELSDAQLDTLSTRLQKDSARRLALHLGVPSADIDRNFSDHPSVSEAAIHILTSWLHGQDDRKEAYRNMGEALRHENVKLKLIAREVLNYPPVEQNQDW